MSALWLIIAFVFSTYSAFIMIRKTTNSDYFAWVAVLGVASWVIGLAMSALYIIKYHQVYLYSSISLFAIAAMLMAVPPIRSWRHRNDRLAYKSPQIRAYSPEDIIPFPQRGKRQD